MVKLFILYTINNKKLQYLLFVMMAINNKLSNNIYLMIKINKKTK